MITVEIIKEMIHEHSACSNEYYKSSRKLEENIQEYLEDAPSKVTVYDEYIRIQIPGKQLHTRLLDKVEKLPYKLHEGDIILPIPRTR